MAGPEPIHFARPEDFRAWLEAHHETEREVSVLFYKAGAGKPTMTWSDAVDQALCFGWIDGRVQSLGPDRFMRRFTPRKPGSIWSRVNVGEGRAARRRRPHAPGAHWVVRAKREETRERRLEQLIECSAAGRHVPPFAPRTGRR